ncbi:MAG TPA: hypothetical protein DCX25_03505 [Candidatus Pacebacteria bacterium]|nr:MAG: Peptidase M23B [Microgenomates group bacterium GW2011_GWB1_45_17]KKU23885.1 MAG: Peptidase M23B [Microgenomates group bacterium GW2011_GWA1_46_15]KKU24722.1 MAG: Peptidase M23B [Microgenomates group bacterium GW2011_GWC1_46_15]HAV15370.1 hypothetical protein [Candidatus Paceibacterota bacterium]HCR11572.1 hypothetical protein [Candidatus Paceibacterota bacterium]
MSMRFTHFTRVFVGAVICFVVFLFAVTRTSAILENCATIEACKQQAAEASQKIAESQGVQKTLSATITYLNNRIRLTEIEMRRTQLEIDALEAQIADLNTRIDGLELSLQRLTEILLERVQQNYKLQTQDPFLLLLTSNGISDFLHKYRYIQLSQTYTQRVMKDAESQKVAYGEEKLVKEKKQKEVEALRKKLESQRVTLRDQQNQKTALLTATKNDEKKYQDLLARAKAQIVAFSRFVSSQGGASLLNNQPGPDGWGYYYNQRDERWGNILINGQTDCEDEKGNTIPCTMARFGCLVSSMAMIATHYGKSLNPGQIAESYSPFDPNTAFMIRDRSWTVNGVTMTRTRIGNSSSAIDSELNAGRPVVVGLYYDLGHFIVIKGKDSNGYIMNDPFMPGGKDKKFTDTYSLSDIRAVDSVRVQ